MSLSTGQNKCCQVVQVFPYPIGSRMELFCRSMAAIQPERRIPEPLCTHSVPTCKGNKRDLFSSQPEGVHGHSVGPGIRLERPHAIGTQVILKDTLEAGVLHRLIEHCCGKVGEKRHPQAA